MEVVAAAIARRLTGLDDEGQGLFGAADIGGEAALVADIGVMASVLQGLLQAVEDLGAHAQALGEGVSAGGQDHEFLDVDGIVSVRAAIDDVHHRHRQDPGRHPANILVERQVGAAGRGLGRRQADAQDGVGAQARLVGRAVQLDQQVVQPALVLGVEARQGVIDFAIDRLDGLQDALAQIAALVAVPLLNRLVGAGGGARGHGGPAHGAIFQHHIDLDRGIAAAVEDFAGGDVDDLGHGGPRYGRRRRGV